MKSFFTKLGKLLLCGVAVAVVGCTDYDTDIRNVNEKLDGLKQETTATAEDLAEAIAALEAKLAAQYATIEYVDGLNKEVKDQLTKDVTALSGRIDEANKAIADAVTKVSAQLADLDEKKADKTALNEAVKAIEGLEKELNDVKTDLEGEIETVKTQIADAKAELNEKIAGVDAKANELQNTLASLSEYLEGLEAKVNEINNTLLSLSEYLPKMKAELEAKINAVDAKAEENYNTLVSLSEHLTEYEATTDLKLTELQGSLAALSTYLETYEAEVEAKFTEIRNTLDSLSEYLEEKFAELADTDTDLYNEIDGLREVITTINNLLAVEKEERVAADEALEAKIQELRNTLLSLEPVIADLQNEDNELWKQYNELQANVGQIYATLTERINATDAALAAHKAAYETKVAEIEAKINELNNTLLSLSEYLPEMKAALEAQIQELRNTLLSLEPVIEALENEDVQLQQQINEVQSNLAAALNAHDDDVADIYAALQENTEELAGQIETTQEALSSALLHIAFNAANIDKLLAQVQSLVYVPEYNDHKATLDFAKVGKNIYIPAVSTLRYVVKSNGVTAEELAKSYAVDNTILSYLTKEVAVRAKADAAAELEIVKVYADKEGYLCVDVLAKNFDPAFYTNEASYSVALALVQAEETNNLTSEYTNLVPAAAPKHKASFCVQTLFEGQTNPQAVVSNASGNMCIIQRNGFIATNDTETVYKTTSGVPGLVIDNKFYNEEELLEEFGYAIDVHRAYRTISYGKDGQCPIKNIDHDDTIWYFSKTNFVCDPEEINADNKVISLTEVPSTEQTGRVGMYTVVEYSYGLGDIYITNKYTVTIANKVVSYDVPAVVVPWTMGLADSLSVLTNDVRVLYRADLVRNAPYTTPEDFEGFTLHSIVQTGETIKREVTFNGAATTDVDIQASIKDSHVVLTLINANEKGYAFPEHDAENEYNEYKITWIKEHESVTATVTATLLLGKKPAPVAVPMEDVTLQLIGKKANYYTAPVDFVQAAYDKFAELGLLGYADVKAGEAAFKAAFEVADPSDANNNTVTVNGSKGSYNNVSYASSLIRFYNNNVYAADGQNYVSQVNNLWFEVPFTFTVKGILDEPSYGLVFSQADFVTPENETYGKVEVDGDIVNNVFTIDQADLAKYFEVSNDVDNDNDLTVKFIVTTKDAPKPETTDVVAVSPVEGYNNLVLATEQAVIKDWTNGGNFVLNNIVVEAVLMANGTFELDRKTVELYTPDPLEIATETLFVTRYPGKDAVAKTYGSDEFGHYGLTITSTEEEGNLVNVGAWTSKGIFYNSHADVTYGAKFVDIDGNVIETNAPVLKRVYVEDAEGNVVEENYNPLKYQLVDGTFTVFAEDAILKNTIVAEVEYRFTHNFNYGNVDVKTVVVKFVPASADEYAL